MTTIDDLLEKIADMDVRLGVTIDLIDKDYFQDLVSEAYELGKRDGFQWQPIETAPKDGTLVLIYIDGSPEFGYYQNSDYACFTGWYIPNNGDYYDGGYGKAYKAGDGEYNLPTYWAPLPNQLPKYEVQGDK